MSVIPTYFCCPVVPQSITTEIEALVLFFFLFFSHSHLSSGLYLWSIIYFYLIEENTMERVFSINSYYASYLFSELFMSILLSVWEK